MHYIILYVQETAGIGFSFVYTHSYEPIKYHISSIKSLTHK